MSALTLWFSAENSSELYRTEFVRGPGAKPLVAVRGKTAGAHPGASSFQWTAAVQALSILLLRSKLSFLSNGVTEFALLGRSGSPASSLGFALSRLNNWIDDMFGVESDGSSHAKHLFRGSNYSGRRQEPTAISLNTHRLCGSDITVLVNDRRIDEPKQLALLATSIEVTWHEQQPGNKITPAAEPLDFFSTEAFRGRIRETFRSEIISALRDTDVFTRTGLERSLGQIYGNEVLKKLGVNKFALPEKNLLGANSRSRYALDIEESMRRRVFTERNPVRIAVPPAFATVLVLFNYLRYVKGYAIIPDIRFAYSQEVVDDVLSQNHIPDGCVLGLSTAAAESKMTRAAHGGFRPCMILPKISIRSIAPKRNIRSRARGRTFGFLAKRSHALSVYFEQIKGRSRSGVRVIDIEPDEASVFLHEKENDFESLLWFPNFNFNVLFNDCTLTDEESNDLSYQGSVLLLREELMRNPDFAICLQSAVRDAWLRMREVPGVLEREIDRLLNDQNYITALARYGGISSLSQLRDGNDSPDGAPQTTPRDGVLCKL